MQRELVIIVKGIILHHPKMSSIRKHRRRNIALLSDGKIDSRLDKELNEQDILSGNTQQWADRLTPCGVVRVDWRCVLDERKNEGMDLGLKGKLNYGENELPEYILVNVS